MSTPLQNRAIEGAAVERFLCDPLCLIGGHDSNLTKEAPFPDYCHPYILDGGIGRCLHSNHPHLMNCQTFSRPRWPFLFKPFQRGRHGHLRWSHSCSLRPKDLDHLQLFPKCHSLRHFVVTCSLDGRMLTNSRQPKP